MSDTKNGTKEHGDPRHGPEYLVVETPVSYTHLTLPTKRIV